VAARRRSKAGHEMHFGCGRGRAMLDARIVLPQTRMNVDAYLVRGWRSSWAVRVVRRRRLRHVAPV